jgi:hypothetical protein
MVVRKYGSFRGNRKIFNRRSHSTTDPAIPNRHFCFSPLGRAVLAGSATDYRGGKRWAGSVFCRAVIDGQESFASQTATATITAAIGPTALAY